MALHDMILQAVSTNWEEYLEDLQAELSEIVNITAILT